MDTIFMLHHTSLHITRLWKELLATLILNSAFIIGTRPAKSLIKLIETTFTNTYKPQTDAHVVTLPAAKEFSQFVMRN
jgi:hypothetical protein